MNLAELTSLGRSVEQQPKYSADILVAIPRALGRQSLGVDGAALPFIGGDRWTGYELSWLNPSGVPQVAVLKAWIPVESPALVESKSFKLYLNSYARLAMPDTESVGMRIAADLAATAGATVDVELLTPRRWQALQPCNRDGFCIDTQDISITGADAVQPHWLTCDPGRVIEQVLVSHLLKSNCPVTGQPDWASVYVDYRGQAIDPAGLLRYLVSFREVREFHEQCVERIYLDIWRRCKPQSLRVEARYTRRGGLDINPVRASAVDLLGMDLRDWRQ